MRLWPVRKNGWCGQAAFYEHLESAAEEKILPATAHSANNTGDGAMICTKYTQWLCYVTRIDEITQCCQQQISVGTILIFPTAPNSHKPTFFGNGSFGACIRRFGAWFQDCIENTKTQTYIINWIFDAWNLLLKDSYVIMTSKWSLSMNFGTIAEKNV